VARPGDPFETEELDRLRSEQRRRLCLIDDDVVRHVASNLPLPLRPEDRHPCLEGELRALARQEDVELDSLLQAMEGTTKAAALAPFLRDSARGRTENKRLDSLVQEAQGRAGADLGTIPDEHADRLIALVTLLLLADELAPDAYRDPRLPTPSAHGTAYP
jgi:hypothetical protein